MRWLVIGVVLLYLTIVTAQAPAAPAAAPSGSGYGSDSNFVGPWNEIPVNSVAHLQRDLQEDKKFVASILRSPVDSGDPGLCSHKDLARDKRRLRRLALRLNNRRIALKQQQQWITDAQNGIAKIKEEMRQTGATSRSLSAQLDALQNQKNIIMNHVRQELLQQQLDATSSTLKALKEKAKSK